MDANSQKITAHTVRMARRAGIGAKPELELTDEDRARFDAREAERLARLARIAARNTQQA